MALENAKQVVATLKGFFHGSAHARVLRNLICLPARNKANFWGFTRRSVEGGFHLKNLFLSLCISHRWSENVLFGSYVILAFGFNFILLFLHLTFLKVINFQMWFIKSRATSRVTIRRGSQISSKSHHW